MIAAADLDRTLIYSRAACLLGGGAAGTVEPPDLVCVEWYDGRPASFLTRTAATHLARLAAQSALVPVTTRTREQLARVRLPHPTRYAVAANGGFLLVDGVTDGPWTAAVTRALRGGYPLADVVGRLAAAADPAYTTKLRVAEGLFAYLVVERSRVPDGLLAELAEWLAAGGWRLSVQGRKVYAIPGALSKRDAVRALADRLGSDGYVAAGDSLLDGELLDDADAAIRPAHGELHEHGYHRPHVSVTAAAGVRAGEEIAAWLLARAGAGSRGVRALAR